MTLEEPVHWTSIDLEGMHDCVYMILTDFFIDLLKYIYIGCIHISKGVICLNLCLTHAIVHSMSQKQYSSKIAIIIMEMICRPIYKLF